MLFYGFQFEVRNQNKKAMLFEKDNEEELALNYQLKKIAHMIQLQIMDIESSLHYIQKKHSTSQLKEALSQIYNIFNETEPIFKHIKGSFLHSSIKKLMNCFGIIYLILNQHIDSSKKNKEIDILANSQHLLKESLKEENKQAITLPSVKDDPTFKMLKIRPFGGISLYNENYQRYLNFNKEPKVKATIDTNVINTMTKEDFRKSVMDQINDNSLGMPNPDQMMDLFTFKFKYGKESQLVTFHDELQSIAKYFKDAQNDAFEFLNKTKDQNSTFTYNESFKDIMSHIKIEKERKLREFNEKIKLAFRSIKKKTERQMLEIQSKLEEVQQIKNNYKPPITVEHSVQTTYNFEEELRYLKRRVEDAEQKYQLMNDIKKKEIEEGALNEIALESELGLKAREVVYLKLSLEENSLVIMNLNKKVKMLNDIQKKIRQRIIAQGNQKGSTRYEETLQELDNINKLTQKIAEESQNFQALESIKKQKKVVKKIIVQTKRNSISSPKNQYAKRFTQQNQNISSAVSSKLLSKWNLSQISENNQDNELKSQSSASNVNNLLGQKQIPTNQIKISIHEEARPSVGNQISSQSIKSTLEGNRSRKATRQKKTSHFIQLHRKESLLGLVKKKGNQLIQEFNDFEGSDSEIQEISDGFNPIDNLISEQQMKRLEIMYQNQMEKSKKRVNERKGSGKHSPSSFFQMSSEGSKQRFMSNSYNAESKKSLGQRFSSYSNNNSLTTSLKKNSFRESPPYQVFSILEHEQDLKEANQLNSSDSDNEGGQINKLKDQIEELKKQLEKLNKKQMKICEKEVFITIQPVRDFEIPYGKMRQDRSTQNKYQKNKQHYVILESRTNKVRFDEAESQYSELKTQKYGDLKSLKDQRSGGVNRSQKRMATHMFFRSPSQSKTNEFKSKNASQHASRRPETRQITNATRVNTEKHAFEDKFNLARKDVIPDDESELHPAVSIANDINQQSNIQANNGKENNEFSSNTTNKAKKVEKSSKIDKNYKNRNDKMQNPDVTDIKNAENDSNKEDKDRQEQKVVRELALKCKNIKQFKIHIQNLHKARCGQNCSHLQQYSSNFTKYRQQGKQRLKMHIQNIHHSIQGDIVQLPLLKKKK